MCGICGVLNLSKSLRVEDASLKAMADLLINRGPDDFGAFVDGNFGFAMRRLSIIDIEGGHQPICNEDGSLWVVQNGEIYNFVDWRPLLEGKGHRFKTRSDTEVLLHLYEEYGEDCVNKLEGMFAFAIWDKNKRKLFVGRDRFGKKPFYYAIFNNKFVFASEIKSILTHLDYQKNIDVKSLHKYLTFGYIPAPNTIFESIKKLPASHILTVTEQGDLRIRQYWNFSFVPKITCDEDEILNETEALLKMAVRRRLISDVAVGVFLSGGIDSSLIAALVAKEVSPSEVKTFSIGFEEQGFDESKHAEAVASYLGTNHRTHVFLQKECIAVIPEITLYLDEPMADPSIVPTYLLSKFTRQEVKVALSGDGGDELFAGYPKYYAHKIAAIYDSFPLPLKGYVLSKIRGLILNSKEDVISKRAEQFILGLSYPPSIRNQMWIAPFMPEESSALLVGGGENNEDELFEETRSYLEGFNGNNVLDKMLYLDSRLTFQDMYLTKVDRASMSCSLEVRSPFLDTNLVEGVTRIPASFKLRNTQTKVLLKLLARKYLPKETIHRKKMGFGMPINKWFMEDLKPFILEEFDRKNVADVLNYKEIRKVVDGHLQGRKDNRTKIWTLLIFQLWYKNYFKG
ncbi:MAG: asparagine synthase (glutamine-hydrolyzing) [Planctomycetota bacterium]|jgi:asparagine synthase (glutamine-hydrolysing)